MHGSILSKNIVALHFAIDAEAFCDRCYLHLECAIIYQDFRANRHTLRQIPIAARDTSVIANDGRVNHDLELLAFGQFNGFAFLELSCCHTLVFRIHHDGDWPLFGFLAQDVLNRLHCLSKYLVVAKVEIQSDDVHSCVKHSVNALAVVARWTDSTNNACLTLAEVDLLEDILKSYPTIVSAGGHTDRFTSCFYHLFKYFVLFLNF